MKSKYTPSTQCMLAIVENTCQDKFVPNCWVRRLGRARRSGEPLPAASAPKGLGFVSLVVFSYCNKRSLMFETLFGSLKSFLVTISTQVLFFFFYKFKMYLI